MAERAGGLPWEAVRGSQAGVLPGNPVAVLEIRGAVPEIPQGVLEIQEVALENRQAVREIRGAVLEIRQAALEILRVSNQESHLMVVRESSQAAAREIRRAVREMKRELTRAVLTRASIPAGYLRRRKDLASATTEFPYWGHLAVTAPKHRAESRDRGAGLARPHLGSR